MKIKSGFIFAGIVILFLMSGYLSSAQTDAFKKLKKETDTLIIFSPVTEVYSTDYKTVRREIGVAEDAAQEISRVATDLLDSRYAIKNVQLPSFDTLKLVDFCRLADSIPLLLPVKQLFLPDFKNLTTSKLGILITYYAQYNIAANPYSGNSAGGVSTVTINLSARPFSELRLIAIDLQSGEIIFYNKYDTKYYSPASRSDVEVITRKLLKDVYYK